jgi:hypothetical protein
MGEMATMLLMSNNCTSTKNSLKQDLFFNIPTLEKALREYLSKVIQQSQ